VAHHTKPASVPGSPRKNLVLGRSELVRRHVVLHDAGLVEGGTSGEKNDAGFEGDL
jgi:hypothetical protein